MNMQSNLSHTQSHSSRTRRWTFIAPAGVLIAAMLVAPGFAASPTMAQASSPASAPPAAKPQTPSTPTAPDKKPAGTESGTISNRPTARDRQRPGASPDATTQNLTPNAVFPAPAPQVATTPVLRFEPEVLEFGEMTAGVASTKKVQIHNISLEPVTVSRVVPGCGCTVVSWPKDPIAPGAFAEMEMTLKPPEAQGTDLKKHVTVQLVGHPPASYELRGHVAEYIRVMPKMVDAPGKDETKDGEITLTSVDGTPFKIVGVNPPVVKDFGDEAKTEHKVHVDWPTWLESGKTSKLAFTTDHPKSTNITMMIKRSIRDSQPMPPAGPRAQPHAPATNLIHQAVQAGDAEALKRALATGDVNAVDAVGGNRTALHWAVKDGKKDLIPILLDAKGDIEARDRLGKTPLTLAAEGRDLEIVKLLVERGAKVNTIDLIGGNPVLWAAGLGSPDVVKFLISKGADVNVIDTNGLSPLLWAASIGSAESVEALLQAKARVDVADTMTGDTALMRAVNTGKIESVTSLIKAGANVNTKNKLGHTAFILGSARGSVEKLEALKKAGADVAAKDVRGWNALDHANNRIDPEKSKVVGYLTPIVPPSGAAAASEPTTKPAGETPATAAKP
ncbi:MAG: ankyrin repeat domain-containing protein [Phycisphaerae bacterium]|nr:ankyrin repeat domain-containing protein [Phycisphaerae bacterium]